MKSTESAPAAASTHTYAAPTPNPFIIVSDRSSRLTLIVLVSCALTVALTRLFLVLTGYPQIGNSTFHLAHALWGGLALFLAGMTTLIVQNRGAAVIIALLTGVGFGLFVDEVGKFITQKNDYFFPLAAPVVYASLLLILLFTELARRHQLRNPRAHLLAAISLSQTIADGTATPTEISAMEDHIRQARTGSLDDASAALLNGIETSMVLADRVEESFAFIGRTVRRIHRTVASWLPANPYPSICTFGNGRPLHPRIVPTPAARRRRIHTRRATSDGNAQRARPTCRRLGEDRLPCHLGPERRRRSACRDYLVGAASGADPSTSRAQVWLRCDVAHASFRQPALKLRLPVRDLDPGR